VFSEHSSAQTKHSVMMLTVQIQNTQKIITDVSDDFNLYDSHNNDQINSAFDPSEILKQST